MITIVITGQVSSHLHDIAIAFAQTARDNEDTLRELNEQYNEPMPPESLELTCPYDYDYSWIVDPLPYEHVERKNYTYKNNLTIQPRYHRRCNTPHSGWAGRKRYKKRKGK